ncbi:MAG: diguanylate cyclase [Planctomycetes bacterium]|nr:diguanylate cyclase [Planctomycetota bacterium]
MLWNPGEREGSGRLRAPRRGLRALWRAAWQPSTWQPVANPYVRYGLALGLPVPALCLWAFAAAEGGTGGLQEFLGAAARRPAWLLLLCYPLLSAWVAGILGTLQAEWQLAVAEQLEKLGKRAAHDPLTGVYARRHLLERMGGEIERARRERYPLSCILLDVDNLKPVNERYGHLAGDQMLVEVASVIGEGCRCYDVAGRYGGDEFLVLLPRTDEPLALSIANRILGSMRERVLALPAGRGSLRLTASAGIATFPAYGETRSALVAAADSALEWAKQAGKDKAIHVHELWDTVTSAAGEVALPEGEAEGLEEDAELRTPSPSAGFRSPADARALRPEPWNAPTPPPAGVGPPASRTVLIVEDEADTVEMLRTLLELQGYSIRVAGNGRLGLECLRRETPDLILLDLAMPEMDGFEFCRRATEARLFRGVPIVVLTALDTFACTRERMAELGGVRLFMYKPFHPQTLLNSLRRILAEASASPAEPPAPARRLVPRSAQMQGEAGTRA